MSKINTGIINEPTSTTNNAFGKACGNHYEEIENSAKKPISLKKETSLGSSVKKPTQKKTKTQKNSKIHINTPKR